MRTIGLGSQGSDWHFRTLVIIVTLLLALRALADNPTARIAPQKPAVPSTGESRFGFTPPPGDLSHIQARMPALPLPLAASFDWRAAGKVTPVRNQLSCGSCYAFAAIGNFEARMLIDGAGSFDFSENNVKECEFFGSSCAGGNYWLVANYLATGGTVLESCDPYVPVDVGCNDACAYAKTLLDWCVISFDEVPSTAVLKSYIQNYGPVYTALYAGNGDAWNTEFVTYDGSYTLHYTGLQAPNHAVLIVGWDDTLPHAGGAGAWIVKNSWGTSWGDTCGYGSEGGYFTIAYGSAKIGSHSSFLSDWQDYDLTGVILFHDEGGYAAAVGYGNPTAWGLCEFTPTENTRIERVELWTLDATTDVDVYIYDDFGGSAPANLLTSQLNSSFSLPGYHSIELASPIDVNSGDAIYVVAKVTDASYVYPLAFDNAVPLAPGTSYISSNGSFFSSFGSGDLCIRVRGQENIGCGEIGEVPVIVDIADVTGDNGGYVDLSWRRSIYDDSEAVPEVVRYKIWRKGREALPLLPMLGGAVSSADADGPYEHGLTGAAWELIGTVDATGVCCYEFNAQTHCDSGGSDTCWTYFCVTAHTGQVGEHYDSSVDRGYSVDNQGMQQTGGENGGEGEGEDVEQGGQSVALTTRLFDPEPNPGRTDFAVRFDLARPDWIKLELYDVTGRRVAVLSDGYQDAGTHLVKWRRETNRQMRMSPGLYFLRLVTSSEAHTVKLALIE